MPLETETATIRQASADDLPFIKQMCYEAAFPDELGDRPSLDEALGLDWFRAYTQDWPNQDGDFGLIAEDAEGAPVGAAWYRDYPRDGQVNIPTHELSIALTRDSRGKGLGEKLLKKLLVESAQNGVEGLSLQVKPENKRAKALYSKLGFLTVATSPDGYDVMVASTAQDVVK